MGWNRRLSIKKLGNHAVQKVGMGCIRAWRLRGCMCICIITSRPVTWLL